MKEIMNIVYRLLLIFNTVIFIISFSIAFVILFRPFYYLNIKLLNIEEKTGYTYSEIKDAYDDVIDYTTSNKEFKTGNLKYSDEGYDHFRDCKILFLLDFILLAISGIILILKRLFLKNIKIHNHSIGYYSGISLLSIFTILLVSYFIIGFDRFFTLFHNFFFRGKANWLLDPETDEIINIFPNQFFINCSIIIILLITIISVILIINDRINYKKNN